MGCDALLKATQVDGVYSADPVKDPSARYYSHLTYKEVLEKNLQVLDLAAVALAMGQGLPIIVFNLRKKGNIKNVSLGKQVGTLISGGSR